jgi:phosphate transport system permease protein
MLQHDNPGLRGWFASGEPWIWMNAAAVGISIAAVVGVVLLIAGHGFGHFWPAQLQLIHHRSDTGQSLIALGEVAEIDTLSAQQYTESAGNDGRALDSNIEEVTRWLIKTGNRRYDPPDFRWIFTHNIESAELPADAAVFERMEWGNAYGYLRSVLEAGEVVAAGDAAWPAFTERLQRAIDLRASIEDLERTTLHAINHELGNVRKALRRPTQGAAGDLSERERLLMERYEAEETRLRQLREELRRDAVTIELGSGQTVTTNLAEIVRAWRPNQMSIVEKAQHFLASFALFLTEQPREANTEGGIFPAIFGTVMMVLLMSVLVTPFGVIAAIYLREYAHQGAFVRLIRIAVNNLAGVPSIVYGVFGLGFFVYFVGGNLDQLFFADELPAPTFGTPGLLWASLTLALLTLPVVVVSTEEGLTRIPRSIREGSLALGATKAETLFKVVLPMASPSILTGVILAVARAAGEVAPLMLVGVVKLAPTLPVDGIFPFVHLERKFMHLGFHIYDVGFQSPNVEAARPLVYATALLLVLIIITLNLTAILLRSRLENRSRGVES